LRVRHVLEARNDRIQEAFFLARDEANERRENQNRHHKQGEHCPESKGF
jgi:hypothetical protein